MNWKLIGAFFVGGVIGGVGTWYGVKTHYKNAADEEIAAMNDYYREKIKKLEAENTTEIVLPSDLTEEKKEEILNLLKQAPNGVVCTDEGQKSTYEHIAKQYNTMYKEKPSLESLAAQTEYPTEDDETPDDILEEGIECVREPNPSELPGPTIITEEDFASDWRFEKATITYYSGDQTLADEDDTMIDDIAGTVSQEALDLLVGEDLDAVYVRNEKLGMDYEITLNYNDYSEVVLGFTDEEVGGRVPMKKRKEKPIEDE